MKLLWYITVITVVLAFVRKTYADEEVTAAPIAVEGPVEPATLVEVDSGVKAEGELNREPRQFRTFGFGRPYYGGGFYRPRPYYGGGFYRPRPYYGGGFYRPPFYGGGFYRPPPFYGGYYRPPFYG